MARHHDRKHLQRRTGSSARAAGLPAVGESRTAVSTAPGRKAQTAVTAGTLSDRRRTPLTFPVCWEFAGARDGVSVLALQRTLQIGSYRTAWAMLHRLRSALIRPGRELLSGPVEVDETCIGREEVGLPG